MSYFILLCLVGYLIYCLVKDIKRFVLTYIAMRSLFSAFNNVNVLPGIEVLELVGVLFPTILLLFWAKKKFRYSPNRVNCVFAITTIYVVTVSFIKIIDYNIFDIYVFNLFLRWLNGFAVFITFPLIFSNREDVERLMKAFLIYAAFPLLQFLLQLLVGPNVFGFSTGQDFGRHEMYAGLYGKYGVFATAVLLGSLATIYQFRTNYEKHANKQKALYSFLFALFWLMALSTLSRTLFVTMIVLTMAFLSAQIRSLSIPVIIIAVIPLFVFSDFLVRKYEETLQRSESEFAIMRGEKEWQGLFHGRADRWQKRTEIFQGYSLSERIIGTPIALGPHGDYINWMLQHGYIGIGLYIFLLCKILSGLFKSKYSGMSKYLREFRIVVLTAMVVWILEAIIHNPSNYPDYMYAILGSVSLFFFMFRKEVCSQRKEWV